MKNCLLFIFLLCTVFGGWAQEPNSFKDKFIRLDSTKKEKFPAVIRADQLDSLRRAWQMDEDERRTKARKEFLANFDRLPDTLPILRMGRLDLTEMPDISRFKHLKEIHANKNKFEMVPESMFSSDSLRFVDLSNNPVEKLKVHRKTTIVSLKMEGCGLKKIPRQVRKMKKLKRLYLSGNEITRIPRFIKRLKNLSELNLNFNQVVLSRPAVKRLGHIKNLQLAGNGLENLPENIDRLSAARRLNFSKNKLSQLPPSFAGLVSLEVVIFYENSFSEIPTQVTALKSLTELDFYYNNIGKIPDAIGNLQKLERLFLAFNNIETLPDSLRSLKNLRRLYLHHNRLTVIPQWITGLDSLEILDVGYNQLVYFPDVSKMPLLYEVDIQENNLEDIPWKLVKKENLKLLFLRSNLFLEDKNSRARLKKTQKQRLPACIITLD